MLPEWPEGTVTILVTAGDTPHAIPVSAAVRAGESHALIGLGPSRGSLERLRADAGVALLIISEGTAITAHGRARVLDEQLAGGVVAVLIAVDRVQDHGQPTFEILDGVRWRWADQDAASRDQDVRSGLGELASRLAGDLKA